MTTTSQHDFPEVQTHPPTRTQYKRLGQNRQTLAQIQTDTQTWTDTDLNAETDRHIEKTPKMDAFIHLIVFILFATISFQSSLSSL